jgi:ABC-type dipeptide/oligopeptide/nickel transport system permease component
VPVTGRGFARTSERARGATILIRLSLFLVLIIAFAVITETVFQWPGMGALFLKAVQNVDIPIMAAYLMIISALFVTINMVVDLLYAFVDPRLRATIKG